MNVHNVEQWVTNIETALADSDPENAGGYTDCGGQLSTDA